MRKKMYQLSLISALVAFAINSAAANTSDAVRSLLAQQFSKSQRVESLRLNPSAEERAEIGKALGQTLKAEEYIVFIARSGDQVDGYAMFDREIGQHEYIDMLTYFSTDGKVRDVVVVAYREPFGDAIRSSRFRRQFAGKDASSRYKPGRDIDIISGATLSAWAMSRTVQRDAVLLKRFVIDKPEPSAAP